MLLPTAPGSPGAGGRRSPAARRPAASPRAPAFALLALAACGDKTDDSGGPAGGGAPAAPRLEILSPRSGDFFDEGQPVLLDAEARGPDGGAVEPEGLQWSLVEGAWTAAGDGLEVTDLPPGVWTLQADATVGGAPVQATAELIIYAARR